MPGPNALPNACFSTPRYADGSANTTFLSATARIQPRPENIRDRSGARAPTAENIQPRDGFPGCWLAGAGGELTPSACCGLYLVPDHTPAIPKDIALMDTRIAP